MGHCESTVNIKKEIYKLRTFADSLMLVLEYPLKETEILMGKWKGKGTESLD